MIIAVCRLYTQVFSLFTGLKVSTDHVYRPKTLVSAFSVGCPLHRAATVDFLQVRLPQWQSHHQCSAATAAMFYSAKSTV